jgi:hypothetical protein
MRKEKESREQGSGGALRRAVSELATRGTAAQLPLNLATILHGAADILRMVADLLDGLVEELRVTPGTVSARVQNILKSAPALLGTVQGLLVQLRQNRAHAKQH